MIDFGGEQFDITLSRNNTSNFIEARVTDDNEWILDVDYDADENIGLENGDTF